MKERHKAATVVLLERMSCHICLPYFPIGFGWPNMPLMMKENLGTPVFSSKHLPTYLVKWTVENV